jgi:ribosomal protein S18 acetylase RimI-like enzyme
MNIRSLAHIGFETLAGAFGAAFAEYEVQITPDELRTMLRRRGFDPALSFAAFDGAGHIMGFTLNGIGSFGGIPTAYDTGTGTLPQYRGQGLAAQIFETSLPHLRAAGIAQYLLEVLQHNTAAVSVYRRLGFEVSREFNYFRAAAGDVRAGECTGAYEIRQTSPAALCPAAPEFWDFEPSWQNSFEAIERAPEDFVSLGAYDGKRPVGYIIFEPAAGGGNGHREITGASSQTGTTTSGRKVVDIVQIAVAETHRRQGIGSALLGEMLRRNRAPGVKCINTEIGRDASIAAFLGARGIMHAGRQFEMIKKL